MIRWLSLLFFCSHVNGAGLFCCVVLLLSENVTSAVEHFFFSLLVWYEKKALFIEKNATCNWF